MQTIGVSIIPAIPTARSSAQIRLRWLHTWHGKPVWAAPITMFIYADLIFDLPNHDAEIARVRPIHINTPVMGSLDTPRKISRLRPRRPWRRLGCR